MTTKLNEEVDLHKAVVDALHEPSESIAESIMLAAGANPATLAKNLVPTINQASGLVAYDLQAPAKNLYPVYTPIRNIIPRVGGGTGTATNWRQVNSIIGSGYNAMGWVPEGQRAAAMTYNTSNKAASYVTLGEEAQATFESIAAGRKFEDIQARMTMRLLQKTMLKEESGILWGNAGGSNGGVSLGTPTGLTLAAGANASSTLPTLTYSVYVVALTGEGFLNSTLAGGIATTQTITGLDGQTFTLNGGTSARSANATQATVSGTSQLNCSVTAVQGAVGYAWYVGAAASETLQAITTINSATFSAPLAGSRQAVPAAGNDYSFNTLAFNGLFTTAAVSANNAYVTYLATGTPGVGTALTASGRGSVNEIDAMMLAMWNNYQVSIDILFVNAQELKNITTKVLTGATGGSLVNYFQDPKAGEYIITAGGVVEFYYNPFMAPGAGRRIPIMIHPMVPPGTIIGWAKNLPIQYQSNEVPNVVEMKTRNDYYQIDWPLVTRQRQVGVYTEEVLAIYAPFALGILSNITNG